MSKKRIIDNAMRIASYVFNGEYVWLIGSCISFDEEEETKDQIRKAFRQLRWYGLSCKEVKLHVKRHAERLPEPIRFVDRSFRPVETDDLPF